MYIPVCIWHRISRYKSAIFYHQNSPTWQESFKIVLPTTSIFDLAKIEFRVRHRSTSAKSKGDKEKQAFVGFLSILTKEPGSISILDDIEHTIPLFLEKSTDVGKVTHGSLICVYIMHPL